jgi:hypothetical protein
VLGRLTFIKSKPASGQDCFSEIQAYFNIKNMVKIKEGYVMTAREKANLTGLMRCHAKLEGS